MTEIKFETASTDVRGGGYGATAWIAKLEGKDKKFGFKREFCKKDKSGLSGSGASGIITFEMLGVGVYEFRNFCVGSTPKNWEWSGFVEVLNNGTVVQINKEEAFNRI